MTFTTIIFYFFVLGALLGALGILFSKNVFKAALSLLVCLLSVAAIFVMCFADFVAVTQILIYAGGVLIIILFGIMFTSRHNAKPLTVKNTNTFSGIIAGCLLFGLLAKMILQNEWTLTGRDLSNKNSAAVIGGNLISDYSLPFEVIGILLLVTLIGASVIAAFMKLKRNE
jgi:NADH:ubiquinone oxidoreductase subunit 6 (subunit J)